MAGRDGAGVGVVSKSLGENQSDIDEYRRKWGNDPAGTLVREVWAKAELPAVGVTSTAGLPYGVWPVEVVDREELRRRYPEHWSSRLPEGVTPENVERDLAPRGR